MKRLLLLLFIISLALTGCRDDEVEDIPCTDFQVEIDDVCIDLTAGEIQLRQAIEYIKEISNYELIVTITEGETKFEFIMSFDNNMSSIETLNQVDYYIDNNGTCKHVKVINDIVLTDDFNCFSGDTYLLFKNFEYSWFALIDGEYILNEANYEDIEMYFRDEFPNSYLQSFTMSVNDVSVSSILIELNIESEIYLIEMNISSIDLVSIEIPGEE